MSRSKKGNSGGKGHGPAPKPKPQEEANPRPGESAPLTEISPSPCPKQQRNGSQQKPAFWKRLGFWKGLLELAAFCIGVYAVHVYKGQWDASLKANKLTSDNFKASERAWVNANFASPVIVLPEAGKAPAYHFMLHNYGQSPALNVRSSVHLIGPLPSPDYNAIQAKIDGSGIFENTSTPIFNGQEIPISHRSQYSLDATDIGHITRMESFMILGGKVKYFDIFGQEHTTTFCIIYNPISFEHTEGWSGCPTKQMAD